MAGIDMIGPALSGGNANHPACPHSLTAPLAYTGSQSAGVFVTNRTMTSRPSLPDIWFRMTIKSLTHARLMRMSGRLEHGTRSNQ